MADRELPKEDHSFQTQIRNQKAKIDAERAARVARASGVGMTSPEAPPPPSPPASAPTRDGGTDDTSRSAAPTSATPVASAPPARRHESNTRGPH
jgi:hypothetical protein